MASMKKHTEKDMLDELLLDPAKLAEVLEKRPPVPGKSKRKSSNKETVTEHKLQLLDEHARSLGADARNKSRLH